MKNNNRRTLVVVVSLILLTGVAMVIAGHREASVARLTTRTGGPTSGAQGAPTVDAHLVQDKVLRGSDGIVTLAVTLTAPEANFRETDARHAVDLVVVIDRSGSMKGRKITDARRAVQRLMDTLSPQDRLALVAYSNTAESVSGLLPMTASSRRELAAAISGIQPGGGTNLGGGLAAGLDLLSEHRAGRSSPQVDSDFRWSGQPRHYRSAGSGPHGGQGPGAGLGGEHSGRRQRFQWNIS